MNVAGSDVGTPLPTFTVVRATVTDRASTRAAALLCTRVPIVHRPTSQRSTHAFRRGVKQRRPVGHHAALARCPGQVRPRSALRPPPSLTEQLTEQLLAFILMGGKTNLRSFAAAAVSCAELIVVP